MASIHDQALAQILANYADVIEGGNAYSSGTARRGIPGTHSNDEGLRGGTDTPLTAASAGSTTSVVVGSSHSWESARWVKAETPGYFLIGATGTSSNLGAGRRITGWDDTTKTFTTDAFPAATAQDDTFTVRQGFKRLPNQEDPEADLQANGFDRFFALRATPGEPDVWRGAGAMTMRTRLELRLRLLKKGRMHDAIAAVLSNLAIIRAVLPMAGQYGNPDHRDGTYVRALLSEDGQAEVVVDDKDKVVAVDRYHLVYRINTEFR